MLPHAALPYPGQRTMNSQILNAAVFNRQFTDHYRPDFLGEDPMTIQCRFSTGSPLYLITSSTDAEFFDGESTAPLLTVYLDSPATLKGLLEGSIDGMDAFMRNQYRADGHIVQSQLLLIAFRGSPISAEQIAR